MRWFETRVLMGSVAILILTSTVAPVLIAEPPQDPLHRGRLQIVRIRHAGDWDLTPQAIPNLTASLRDRLKFNVIIDQKDLLARDPKLVHYPLLYLNGRGTFTLDDQDKQAIRRHLNPGGGTLFADATGGSAEFDASFRRLVAVLFPDDLLVPIPFTDDFYAREHGFDLSKAQRTAAAGGKADFPDLEGIRIDGHWAVIYSKLDIGQALEKQADIDGKGYTHESALRIGTQVVLEATMP